MKSLTCVWPWRLVAWCLLLFMAGCGKPEINVRAPATSGPLAGSTAPPATRSAVDRAQAEATAIVQAARATALVLQAQAEATALVAAAAATQAPTGSIPRATRAPEATRQGFSKPPGSSGLTVTPAPTPAVEVLRVGFAAEGGFISIQFRAPIEVSEHWWQGSVSVLDETTGVSYREIPVMPKLGPLLSKPKLPGQVGYVMLVNAPTPLKPGAVVTVLLGDYVFEHQKVQG